MKYPKILIAGNFSDLHEYCIDEFLEGLKSLDYPNYEVLFIDNSKTEDFYNKMKKKGVSIIRGKYYKSIKDRLIKNRNVLREKFLEGDYDYYFSIDQDVILNPDTLKKLIAHNKKIITGLYFSYFTKNFERRILPVAWKIDPKNKELLMPLSEKEWEGNKLIEIGSCGSGCILIHKEVIKKIKFRYEKDKDAVDDVYFCLDARRLGYKIYADSTVKCKHMISGRTFNWQEEL